MSDTLPDYRRLFLAMAVEFDRSAQQIATARAKSIRRSALQLGERMEPPWEVLPEGVLELAERAARLLLHAISNGSITCVRSIINNAAVVPQPVSKQVACDFWFRAVVPFVPVEARGKVDSSSGKEDESARWAEACRHLADSVRQSRCSLTARPAETRRNDHGRPAERAAYVAYEAAIQDKPELRHKNLKDVYDHIDKWGVDVDGQQYDLPGFEAWKKAYGRHKKHLEKLKERRKEPAPARDKRDK